MHKNLWRVQVGKDTRSSRGTYRDKYTFAADDRQMAALYFHSINVHSGFKKRLVDPDGKVVNRVLT